MMDEKLKQRFVKNRSEIIGAALVWLLIFAAIAWRDRYPPTPAQPIRISTAAERRAADLREQADVLRNKADKLDDDADAAEAAEIVQQIDSLAKAK